MFSWVTEVKHLFEDGLTRNMIDFFPRVEFLAKNVVNTNNENITTISWTGYLIDPFNAGPNYTPARLHQTFYGQSRNLAYHHFGLYLKPLQQVTGKVMMSYLRTS